MCNVILKGHTINQAIHFIGPNGSVSFQQSYINPDEFQKKGSIAAVDTQQKLKKRKHFVYIPYFLFKNQLLFTMENKYNKNNSNATF